MIAFRYTISFIFILRNIIFYESQFFMHLINSISSSILIKDTKNAECIRFISEAYFSGSSEEKWMLRDFSCCTCAYLKNQKMTNCTQQKKSTTKQYILLPIPIFQNKIYQAFPQLRSIVKVIHWSITKRWVIEKSRNFREVNKIIEFFERLVCLCLLQIILAIIPFKGYF